MTASDPRHDATPFHALLRRVVDVERREVGALVISFATFFALLCAYYLIRPVRDEISASVTSEMRHQLFSVVFVVMLIAVPLFGWLVSRYPRERVLPAVYGFFIATLAVFWFLLINGKQDVALWAWHDAKGVQQTFSIAAGFFVWGSVFNLFVVSLFWILMSELWSSEQAKRLYGFLAAGGTAGAFTGPLIAQTLATMIRPTNLLIIAGVLLTVAMLLAVALRRRYAATASVADTTKPAVTMRDLVAGAEHVWHSPYLFRIAMWVLIANIIGTFFYLEQSEIIGRTITDKALRVQFLARLDLTVSVLTIILQLVGTGWFMSRLGVGWAAGALPCVATLGLVALSVAPTLVVVATVLAAERTIAFALSSPAIKVMYTVVEPEEKYKAQNFIDTVVYRGGDAVSGWIMGGLGRDGLGLSITTIAAASVPLALVWLALSHNLGARQTEKAAAQGGGPSAAAGH